MLFVSAQKKFPGAEASGNFLGYFFPSCLS